MLYSWRNMMIKDHKILSVYPQIIGKQGVRPPQLPFFSCPVFWEDERVFYALLAVDSFSFGKKKKKSR